MLKDAMNLMGKWVEELEAREYPVSPDPFSPPIWARETITERIEPWATEHDDLWREHPDYWSCPDCGGEVDAEYYQPTQKLIDLDERIDALHAKGFREVPNPQYDAERAEAWREKQRNRYNATTIQVHQSYAPPFVRHIIVGDHGPSD